MEKISKDLGKKSGPSPQTEDGLLKSEDLYRNAFDVALDGIAIVDAQGFYVDANRSYCKMLGYTFEELIGMSPAESLHPDYRHQLMDEFIPQIRKKGKVRLDSMMMRKDGTLMPIELHGVRFFHAGVPAFMAVVRDVTERRRAEEALSASEEKYRFLTDNVADGFWLFKTGR